MTRDTDQLIRAALTPAPEVYAPADLASAILELVEATPQRRGLATRLLPRSTGLRLVLALVVLAVALAGALLVVGAIRPARPPGILGYHGPPQRTGVMPGPGPAGPVGIVWTTQVAGPIGQTTTPLVVDGRVYIAFGRGTVAVLNERSGRLEATLQTPAGEGAGSLAIADGRLIDGTDGGAIVTWNLPGLIPDWRWSSGTGSSLSIASTDDVVIVSSQDGHVYALDPRTGAPRWPAPLDAGGPVSRSAAVDGPIGVVGADSGRITAFDTSSGAVRWTHDVRGTEVSTPTIAGGVVYAASGTRGGSARYELTALDLATGAPRWPAPWSPPTTNRMFVGAVDGPDVYVVSEDGSVYRINATTGAGSIFERMRGPIGALPSIVGGVLYVASGDRTITAVNRPNGARIWTLPLPGQPSGPAVVDGLVIVGTDVGRVLSIGGSGASTGSP